MFLKLVSIASNWVLCCVARLPVETHQLPRQTARITPHMIQNEYFATTANCSLTLSMAVLLTSARREWGEQREPQASALRGPELRQPELRQPEPSGVVWPRPRPQERRAPRLEALRPGAQQAEALPQVVLRLGALAQAERWREAEAIRLSDQQAPQWAELPVRQAP